jgi:hypothetical protein
MRVRSERVALVLGSRWINGVIIYTSVFTECRRQVHVVVVVLIVSATVT